MTNESCFAGILRKEESIGTFIPYSSHVTREIVKLVSGDYLLVMRLQGAAHESADVDDIESWHSQLNSFFRNIASTPHRTTRTYRTCRPASRPSR